MTHVQAYLSAVRFIVIGATSALLNIVLLWLFAVVFDRWYVAASIVAYGMAAGYNFLLQRSWAFAGSSGCFSEQVPYFAVANLLGLMLNTSIFAALITWVAVPYLLAQALASMAVAVVSFFAYRWIFERSRIVSSTDPAHGSITLAASACTSQ